MRPPAWFVKSIGILDPLLSVRRSTVSSHWVIERKGVIAPSEVETLKRRRDRVWRWVTFPNEDQKKQIHQNRIGWQSLSDEVVSAEAGKRVICRPRELTQAVYNDLCASDMKRYGGAARYCTQLEQDEERREADVERMASNRRQAMNAEIYDMMKFLDSKKSDAMANGHQDLGYLLHGRHTKAGDAPLIQLTDF